MNKLRSINLFAVAGLILLLAGAGTAQAASATWTNKADLVADWITDANWNLAAPGSTSDTANTDIATFSALSGATTARWLVIVDSNRNIGGITFKNLNTNAGGNTLTNGNLMLTSGGTIQQTNGSGGNNNRVECAIEIQGDGGTAVFNAQYVSSANNGLNIGGAVTGVSSAGNTTTLTLTGPNNDGKAFVSGAIGDGSGGGKLAIVKSGSGMWKLSGPNTYSGDTTIVQGTLGLTGGGSISNSPVISIASGAKFDVSGLTVALALEAGQKLISTATGANTTGTITMDATEGLTLSAGGLEFPAYGGGAIAPLTIGTAGTLDMNGAPVTVTNTTLLVPANYTLIASNGTATVTGTPGPFTLNGSGIAASCVSYVSVTGGQLVLTVFRPGATAIMIK